MKGYDTGDMMNARTKWRVGVVPYLNVMPLVWEIERFRNEVTTITATPREIAALLGRGEVDAGIIPTYEYLTRDDYDYIPGICISSNGPVKSVGVFTSKPMGETESILLTRSSKTSIALLMILLKEHFHHNPHVELSRKPVSDYEELPPRYDGYLVIGDRAMQLNGAFSYFYDLGQEWKTMTGLPFVFALWGYQKGKDVERLKEILLQCKSSGMVEVDAVTQKASERTGLPIEVCREYFTLCMDYDIDDEKLRSLEKFRQLISKHHIVV